MSWKSPYPNHRYTEGLVDVNKAYARKRKVSATGETSDSRPPDTEQGASEVVGSNPSSHAEMNTSSSPKMNPSASVGDRRASPESDPDFERREKKTRYPRQFHHKPPLHLLHPTSPQIPAPPPPPENPVPEIHSEDGTFTTRLHYNGVLEEGFGKNYVNGELQYVYSCDPDRWSKLEVDDVLEKLGVDVIGLEYYYRIPRMSFEDGMVRLFDNKSAIEMAELGVSVGVIDVYVIHPRGVGIDSVEEPVSQLTQLPVSQLTQEKIPSPVREHKDGLDASDESEDDDNGKGSGNGNGKGSGGDDGGSSDGDDEGSDEGEGKGEGEGSDAGEGEGEGEKESEEERVVSKGKGKGKAVGCGKGRGNGKEKCKGKGKGERVANEKGKGKVDHEGRAAVKGTRKGKAKRKDKVGVDADADDDNGQPTFVDSDYDLSDKEEDSIMTAQVEGWKNVVNSMRVLGDLDDGGESDNLRSDSPSSGTSEDDLAGDGDCDVVRTVSRRYKPATDLNDPRLEVGLRFNTKEYFKELIRHQGVKLGKKLRLKKNDNIRCVAHCKGLLRSKKIKAECPWSVTLSYRDGLGCWQISSLRDTHKCGGASYNHGCANAKYLSKLFKEDMRLFPGMTVAQFVEKVHWELKITIYVGKAKRAMARASRLIEVIQSSSTRGCMIIGQRF